MKEREWTISANDLMVGKLIVPAKARVWRYRTWALEALKRAAAREPTLTLRLWQVPNGWIILNHYLEALGTRRDHQNIWYALIRS